MTSQSGSNGQPVKSWRTALGEVTDERVVVRGHDLNDLVGRISFGDAMLLLFRGDLPTPEESQMVEAMLVSVVEHGISPSSTISRYLASCGIPIQAAVAGGVLSFGDIHGGAGEELGQLLQESLAQAGPDVSVKKLAADIVADRRSRKERIPGFGHPHHPSGDPRVPQLTAIAEKTGVRRRHLDLAVAIGESLAAAVGRPMLMNIDGILASLVLDLGIDWRLIRAFIFVPRTVGLAAHVIEEYTREPGWRHVPLDDVLYDGPPVARVGVES